MGKMNGSNGKQKKSERVRVARTSADLLAEQVERLKEVFPEATSEGKVDFDKLKATLGEFADDRPERYSFTWAGKRDCIKLLQVPSRATLIPCPDESIDWDATNNVFIEGENLEVLKLLYKAYYGRVKMIYIDPPYNTGKDFIYPDNFADPLDTYLRLTGQKDSEGNVLTSNPETSGRYHSAWLSMMYPRLFVARQLLRDDGVIFVSIDDNEVYNLRAVMNEVFGEENFIATICWQKKQSPQRDATYFSDMHDYVLVYARSAAPDAASATGWRRNLVPRGASQDARYKNPDKDARGPWASVDCTMNKTADQRPNLYYAIKNPITGKLIRPSKQRTWAFEEAKMNAIIADKRLWWGQDGTNFPRLKCFLSEVQEGIVPSTLWLRGDYGDNQEATRELQAFFSETYGVFDNPKPTRLLKGMLTLSTQPDPAEPEIVIDFFAGSATTAQAVLEANRSDEGGRRFVMVQLPEPTGREDFATIADIGKERIGRVIAKIKKEKQGKLATDGPQDLGFRAFKLAESNYKPWKGTDEKDPEKYAKTMEMFLDPLVEGWRPENVIAEVALKEAGFGLNCRVEEVNRQGRQEDAKKKNRAGTKVFRVTDEDKEQFFYICLDDKVRLDDLKPLNLTRDMLFVCRDVALDDETAANLALQCRLRTI